MTEEAGSSSILQRALAAWPTAEVVGASAMEGDGLAMSPDPVARGKRTLVLAKNRGRFIRKCPGTMGLVCCNYWVIDLAEGCAIDCSYCVLQGYLTDRRIRLAVNFDDLEQELDAELAATEGPIRLGTGELSDSLMFDHQLGLSSMLLAMVRQRPRVVLELKTKTDNIDSILNNEPMENIVIAWSLNAPAIADGEEKGAVSIGKRIDAASRAVSAGWKVAFHFDPLVVHTGWEAGYRQTAAMLADKVDPARVEWISLGALRFHPSMKNVIRRRFGPDGILKGEFLLCPDNKLRYAKPIRRKLFDTVKGMLHEALPGAPLYLCMEGAEMWRSVFGALPQAMPLGARRLFA
ncbi:MAG: hypothetical protein OEY50_09575 [Nitrospinota bacterium]|nr:hypothetical protein [Nitrospinota bacterium]